MTRAAIFDLDGTLFTGHTWEGVMRYLRLHRRNRLMLLLLIATHLPLGYLARMGLLDGGKMRTAWARNMSWVLRGMSEAEAIAAFSWITDEYSVPLLRLDVVALLREHKERGERIILLSGTFEPLLRLIGERVGADVAIGTQPEVKDGRYTGRTVGPTCQREGKAQRLRDYLDGAGSGIDLSVSTAYADSVYDLPVLEMVGTPVAVYPDEQLAEVARQRGWAVFGQADGGEGGRD